MEHDQAMSVPASLISVKPCTAAGEIQPSQPAFPRANLRQVSFTRTVSILLACSINPQRVLKPSVASFASDRKISRSPGLQIFRTVPYVQSLDRPASPYRRHNECSRRTSQSARRTQRTSAVGLDQIGQPAWYTSHWYRLPTHAMLCGPELAYTNKGVDVLASAKG